MTRTDANNETFGSIAIPGLWMGIALVVARLLAWYALPLYDDAFITFRYARNLATGFGFVYNPGEWVLGTTTPAYGLLVSTFYLIGLPMPETAVVANILFDLATLLLTLLAFKRMGELRTGLLFGALFAFSPIMARVCVGGMEASLYLLCSVSAITLYHNGRSQWAILVAALSYFLRPEAVILVGVLCVAEFVSGKRSTAFRMALTVFLAVVPFLLLIYLSYGQFLSQSVVAKSTVSHENGLSTVWQLLSGDAFLIAMLLPALYGAVVAVRRKNRFLILLSVWIGLYLVAYGIGHPKIWSWYGEPIYYGVMSLAAVGIIDLLQRLPKLNPLPNWSLMVAGAAAVAAWIAVAVTGGASPVRTHVYEPLHEWASQHIAPDDTIVAYDIGAIGYYSSAHIYDAAGLVTPDAGRHKDFFDAVGSVRPDYLFLFATRSTIGEFLASSERNAYVPIARFSRLQQTALDLDTTDLPTYWLQDYIVFERRDSTRVSRTDARSETP